MFVYQDLLLCGGVCALVGFMGGALVALNAWSYEAKLSEKRGIWVSSDKAFRLIRIDDYRPKSGEPT